MPNATNKEILVAISAALEADATLASYVKIFKTGLLASASMTPCINTAIAATNITAETIGRRGYDTHTHTVMIDCCTQSMASDIALLGNAATKGILDMVNDVADVVRISTLDGELEAPMEITSLDYGITAEGSGMSWVAVMTLEAKVRVQRNA